MNKKLWIGLIILVILLIGTTYAWWVWNSEINTNVSLTVEGIDITYEGGTDITGIKLIPVSSKEVGVTNNTAIKKTVTASSSSTTYMNLYLTLETLPSGLKDESFVYEIYNGANLVGSGNFASYNQGARIKIANAQKITSSTTSFQLYIWIDANKSNSSSMMNQTFKFVLSADATDNTPANQTLTKLGATVKDMEVTTFGKIPYLSESDLPTMCTNFGFPDVATCLSESLGVSSYEQVMATGFISTVDDNGLFETEDDLGTAYYYRGNVENNYVYFAGAYWRIMRINGDGTIRMIYDGPTKKHNGTQDEDRDVTDTDYNYYRNSDADNGYVGYMYGTPNSDYTNTHKNIYSSTIKQANDKWYEDTIIAGGYDKYIADAIYCNDRKVTTGTFFGNTITGDGTAKNATAYDTLSRMYRTTVSPTLKCSQDNDKFSVTDIGNGDLTYPVALATTDELVMAGYTLYNYDLSTYLPSPTTYAYSYYSFWTMSPFRFSGSDADVFAGIGGSVKSKGDDVRQIRGLRPVVSLKSDTPFSSGDGSYDQPFVVG